MHVPSTRFPQAAFALALAWICTSVQPLFCAPDAQLFRIFLRQGGSVVSYGEFAKVADRVVFSVPLGDLAADPKLQVLSIAEGAVDWEQTDAYAKAVRAKRYAETRGEDDYALLVGQVTAALNDITGTPDPRRRLAMAHEARRNLAAWPEANHGYKAAEVARLVALFDDAIAELDAAAGGGSIQLNLVAMTEPPPPVPLLAAPDLRGSLELAYEAAMIAAEPAERVALLRTLAESTRYAPAAAPWAAALRAKVTAVLASEEKTDRAYTDLARRMLRTSAERVSRADVRGLQDSIAQVLRADATLGRKRPGEVAALLATLDARLDEARRLRLARDAWIMRVEAIKTYREAIVAPLERFGTFRKYLESIRALAGPDPRFLRPLQDRARLAHLELTNVTPPAEARGAHDLLVAALHMVRQAAALRLNAVSSNDSKIAWDASAAAAGAITLGARAVDELERLISSQPTR